MKDEIKEILEYLKNGSYLYEGHGYEASDCQLFKKLDRHETECLLDYITNLQEELKKKNDGIKAFCDDLCETTEQLEDYKSRCEEAIEYLEYQISQLDFEKDTKAKMLGAMVLVLLKGSNKE